MVSAEFRKEARSTRLGHLAPLLLPLEEVPVISACTSFPIFATGTTLQGVDDAAAADVGRVWRMLT